ncbi:hypothetical protein C8R47DRAFT_934920, partial [Mycena vitilis]
LDSFHPQASEFGLFLDWGRMIQQYNADCTISSALLNALYMWGAHFSLHAQYAQNFKQRALRSASTEVTDELFMYTLQAEVLLSYFFLRTADFLEARTHTATAVALVVGAGLHEIRSLHQPDTPLIGIAATATAPGGLRLRPPADPLEEGERINAFWAVFMLDKYVSIALDPPHRICGVFEGLGMRIDTPWPLELDDYVKGLLPLEARGDSTVELYLAGVPSFPSRPSMIAMNARACILLHRAIHMQGANDADVQQNLAILHGLIIALRSELPNSILLQGCKSLRTVLLTRSLLNAATISVHVVDYSEPAAREICLTAAQDMFNLLGEQPKALKCLNPFM